MRHCYATVMGSEVHYVEYLPSSSGSPKSTIVMVHGLARTSHDFHFVASFLCKSLDARVICPDVLGRGFSAWSSDPENQYNPVYYAVHLAALLQQLGVDSCTLFGTSMGGLIAILGVGAKTPLAPLVRRVILNDIGPFVPPSAIQRIMTYMVAPPQGRRVSDLIKATADSLRLFGYDLSDEERFELLAPCIRRLPDGQVTLHFDPAILKGFKAPPPGTPDLWYFYEQIGLPILILRGEDSDVLLQETADEMITRKKQRNDAGDDAVTGTAQLIVIPRCGHAPSFSTENDCVLLLPFLNSN